MARSPQTLDDARRRWLQQHREMHREAPGAETAIELARAEWMCGEYEQAIGLFAKARDLAPDVADHHLSLVRAASSLDRRELEAEALAQARRIHPDHPGLALHAALRLLPGQFEEALALVSPHAADPVLGLYTRALRLLAKGEAPGVTACAGPRLDAMWASFLWMHGYGGPEVFFGFAGDVLQRALQAAPATGTTLECGVYFGRSLRQLAASTVGEVHGFDSFEGLPEAWHAGEPQGAYSTGGRLPAMPGNVRLHAGWFEQTLPPFFASHPEPVRLLHIDCDIHSSTRTVLDSAHPNLVAGSILLFDDFLGYPEYREHELRAFEEYVVEHGVRWELVAGCLLGRVVAIRIT